METSHAMDRETIAYHFRRSFENWYGVAIKARDDSDAETILAGLNRILAENSDYQQARADGQIIFARGNYDSVIHDKIKSYARDHASFSVILEGTYFDFLGRRWQDYAKKDHNF